MQPQEPTKKMVSLTIDSALSDQARAILSEMGLTQAAVVTALFKRIVADGAVPFDVKLSDAQKAMLEIQRMAQQLPADDLTDKDALKAWFADDSQDD